MKFTCLTKYAQNGTFGNIQKVLLAIQVVNLLSLTILDGFVLSHIMKSLSHAGATVRHPCMAVLGPNDLLQ